MRKAAQAFRTISEVAELLRTPAHVLRFWESKFTQVKPVKRAGGRRYYRPADVALLAGIRTLLHDQGMTIRGVQKLLSDKGLRHVADQASPALRVALDIDDAAGDVIDADYDVLEASDVDVQDFGATNGGWPDAAGSDQVGSDAELPDGAASDGAEPEVSAALAAEAGTAPPEAESLPAHRQEPVPEFRIVATTAPDATLPASVILVPEPDLATDGSADPAPEGMSEAPSGAGSDIPAAAPLLMASRLRLRDPGAPAFDVARLDTLVRRIDALVDRMAHASGARRW